MIAIFNRIRWPIARSMLNLRNRPPLFFKNAAARWAKYEEVGWVDLVSWQAKQVWGNVG